MGKLLRLRDYVILSAAFAGDLIDVTRLGWGVVPAAMKGRYGYVPTKYKQASYLSTVSRMLSTDDIKRVTDKKGRSYLEMTSAGKKNFKRRFPLFIQRRRWDGYFMVVSYDIPEEDKRIRNALRTKLIQLGFGMLQKSVWVSPYHFEEDLQEYMALNGMERLVYVLSAKKLLMGDLENFAKKVWKIKSINKGYKRIIKILKRRSDPEATKKVEISKVYSLYLQILSSDPLLPKEFLPDDWKRDEALVALNEAIKL